MAIQDAARLIGIVPVKRLIAFVKILVDVLIRPHVIIIPARPAMMDRVLIRGAQTPQLVIISHRLDVITVPVLILVARNSPPVTTIRLPIPIVALAMFFQVVSNLVHAITIPPPVAMMAVAPIQDVTIL